MAVGQAPWWSTTDQLNPDAGIALPVLSTAEPEKLIESPTAQRRLVVVAEMVTFGSPTRID